MPADDSDYAGRTSKTLKVKATAAKDGYQFWLRIKTADGTGLTYQWYAKKPGAAKFTKISGAARNTYSVKAKKSLSGTQFCCVVTNKYGKTVTSKKVKLTVG